MKDIICGVWCALTLALFIGCEGGSSSGTSELGESCTKTSDCVAPLRCIDLVCVSETNTIDGDSSQDVDPAESSEGESELLQEADDSLRESDQGSESGGDADENENEFDQSETALEESADLDDDLLEHSENESEGASETEFAENGDGSVDRDTESDFDQNENSDNDLEDSISETCSDENWIDGCGSEARPFIIHDVDDLKKLASLVNAGVTYSGVYFALANDLDLNYAPWTPIGTTSAHPFSGHFDGNGHVIKKLYINSSLMYIGLFGYTKSASLANLGIIGDGAVSGKSNANCYVGALAAVADGTRIENCYNSEPISCSTAGENFPDCHTGGLVGYANWAIISNSYNLGSVTGSASSNTGTSSSTTYSFGLAGGIAGDTNHSSLTNCYNTGTITGSCNSSGDNFWAQSRTGGLVGDLSSTSITSSYNTGTVLGKGTNMRCYAGGLAGYATAITLVDSSNTGAVTARYYNPLNYSSSGEKSYAGGLLGYINSGSLTTSYNSGSVIATSTKFGVTAGGLAGAAYANVTISTCFNRGSIDANTPTPSSACIVIGRVGGLFGEITSSSASNISFDKCYNTGELFCEAPQCLSGGLIGYDKSAQYLNSYNAGAVNNTSSTAYSGGLVGTGSTPFVRNSYFRSGCATGVTVSNAYGTSETQSYMQSADFVTTLNGDGAEWVADQSSENGGYPILAAFKRN